MTLLDYVVVDAFTSTPFSGNPAAVCLPSTPLDDDLMQALAAEFHLSETCFPIQRPDGDWDLRWFTPTIEVDLCGHATVAAAHALWEQGQAQGTITFHSRSGPLTVSTTAAGLIRLDFPICKLSPGSVPDAFFESIGVMPLSALTAGPDLLFELPDANCVRELRPDFAVLKQIDCRGIIVTAPHDQNDVDFISRFFAPQAGINEDPVTGSAHCALGPFWAKRFNKLHLVGEQASRRGGIVFIDMPALDSHRLGIAGSACTVMNGQITLPTDF